MLGPACGFTGNRCNFFEWLIEGFTGKTVTCNTVPPLTGNLKYVQLAVNPHAGAVLQLQTPEIPPV